MGTGRESKLGSRVFRPEELSSLVLRSLKQDAESELGTTITDAVISVPAYFRDAQRKATRLAATMAGLNVVRLINEPTAAALAYGMLDPEREQQLLVFDLGGGTFDVSVLHCFEGIMEVRSSTGDSRLGGEDFVEAVAQQILVEQDLTADRLSQLERNRLRKAVETAKRRLSEDTTAKIEVEISGRSVQRELSRDEFQSICLPLLDRIQIPLQRALRDASIRTNDLDEIVLVGGATRMPLVRELIARLFGRFPAHSVSPDEAVALGAAVQAGLKAKDAALRERVLTDVAPFSLGIEVVQMLDERRMQGGLFRPLLERNTVIPASRSDIFSTLRPEQTEILINVYQGESRYVEDNVLLGNLKIQVPNKTQEREEVEVRFTYDVDGLLEVEVKAMATGMKRRSIFHESSEQLDADEIERRLAELAALKIHPRDQAVNTAIMERARRMYEEYLGEGREAIGELLFMMDQAVAAQSLHELEKVRDFVEQRLNEFEQEHIW